MLSLVLRAMAEQVEHCCICGSTSTTTVGSFLKELGTGVEVKVCDSCKRIVDEKAKEADFQASVDEFKELLGKLQAETDEKVRTDLADVCGTLAMDTIKDWETLLHDLRECDEYVKRNTPFWIKWCNFV